MIAPLTVTTKQFFHQNLNSKQNLWKWFDHELNCSNNPDLQFQTSNCNEMWTLLLKGLYNMNFYPKEIKSSNKCAVIHTTVPHSQCRTKPTPWRVWWLSYLTYSKKVTSFRKVLIKFFSVFRMKCTAPTHYSRYHSFSDLHAKWTNITPLNDSTTLSPKTVFIYKEKCLECFRTHWTRSSPD